MRVILIIAIFLMKGYSQDEKPMMTNIYRFGFLINPAISSFDFDNSFIGIGHRSQWTNVYQAPRYSFGSYSGRNPGLSYAYDAYILNKTIGPFDYSGLGVDYSYKIRISTNVNVSLGLALGAYRSIIDRSKINDVSNSVDLNNVEETYYFNANLGSVLQLANVRFGLSGSNIIGKKITQDGIYKSELEYNAYLSYVFGINYSKAPRYGGGKVGFLKDYKGGIVLMPIALLSYSDESKLNYDIYLMTEIESIIKFQAGYGKFKGVNLLAGINISDNFEIYYAYDFGGNYASRISVSSHEVSLIYNILDAKAPLVQQNIDKGLTEAQVREIVNKSNIENKKYVDSKSQSSGNVAGLENKIKNLEQKINNQNVNNNDKSRTDAIDNKLRQLEQIVTQSKNDKSGSQQTFNTNQMENDIAQIKKDLNSQISIQSKNIEEINKRINNLEVLLGQKTNNQNVNNNSNYDKSRIESMDNKLKQLEQIITQMKNDKGGSQQTFNINQIENDITQIKKDFNSQISGQSRNIEEISKRINNLETLLEQKTLSKSGASDVNKIYVDNKINNIYREVDRKTDSLINLINNIDRIQDVNIIQGNKANDNSLEINKKIIELREYIDNKLLKDQNISVNQNIDHKEIENLDKKIEILKIYIDNKLKNIDSNSDEKINYSNDNSLKSDDYKIINDRMTILENQLKKMIKSDNIKVNETEEADLSEKDNSDGVYYLVIGVFYTEPIKSKEELIKKGYINSNYIIDNESKLYYLYIDSFDSEQKSREYIDSIKYNSGNIWVKKL